MELQWGRLLLCRYELRGADYYDQANQVELQTGLFTFFLGFFRLGFLDVVLGRALLRGFITAVAIVIMM